MSAFYRCGPRLAVAAAVTAVVMAALLVPLVRWMRPPLAEPSPPGLSAERAKTHPANRGAVVDPPIIIEKDSPPPSEDGTPGTQTSAISPRAPLPQPESVPSTAPPSPEKKSEPVPAATPRYKAGDTFMQEVVVTRQSAYRILGLDVGQNVRYVFVSRLTIDKVERDGGLVVKQKVEEARFSEGDPAMQALLNDALKKTQGATFEITLDSKGEVTRFKGAKEPIQVFGGNNPLAGQTFLLWSFLDEDAWKELAQITFFRPDQPLRAGAKWERKLRHSWGPLGDWSGHTTYTAAGKQGDRERITYTHDMTYQPPRGAGRDLPFLVKKTDFRPLVAGGVILFDPEQEKVADAEETFRVRGALVVVVADVEAAVEMDETQVFRLRITRGTPGK